MRTMHPRSQVDIINFPISDHVKVSYCSSQTNGIIHCCTSHRERIFSCFRQIIEFHFRENPQGRFAREEWPKQSHFCKRAMEILSPRQFPCAVEQPHKNKFLHYTSVTVVKRTIVHTQRIMFMRSLQLSISNNTSSEVALCSPSLCKSYTLQIHCSLICSFLSNDTP